MSLFRFLGFELSEVYLFRLRYVGLLALAMISVALAGSLAQVTVQARGILFSSGLSSEEQEQIRTFLGNFSNINLAVVDTMIDPAEMRRQDAPYGLGIANGRLTAVWNGGASEQIALQIAEPPPDAAGTDKGATDQQDKPAAGNAKPAADTERDFVEEIRAALLSGLQPVTMVPHIASHVLVTKVLAFIAVFAPFLFGLESLVRQRLSQTVSVYVAGTKGRWLAYCAAKVTMAALLGTAVLFAGLVLAGALFDLLPTEGLGSILWLYVPAALASASLGVAVGLVIESNRALGAVAGYFLALLLFGGMFLPLSTAGPVAQWASYLLPLGYVLEQVHLWLMEGNVFDPLGLLAPLWGSSPSSLTAGARDLVAFGALVAGYLALIPLAISWSRGRA